MRCETKERESEMKNVNIGDEIQATISGKERTFKVSRIHDFADQPRARQNLIDNGWDGSWYWVDGPRGAHKLCYRNAQSGKFEVAM